MVKYLLFFAGFLISMDLFAQSESSVTVIKDPRIDILLKKQAEINNVSTRNSTKRRNTKGYRILVISTNKREEAIAAKTAVYNYFPQLKAYMWHQSPYYKVKAGNFTSRAEAANYQNKLSPYFPRGVFIMNDIVEVKPEEVENQN